MADPQRLVDDPDASSLGRTLLASASADAPTEEHRAAIAKRLGIAAILVGTGSQVGAGAAAATAWWKAGVVVAVLGAAITAGVVLTRSPEPAAPPERVVEAPARVVEPAPRPAPPPAAIEPPPAAIAPAVPAPEAPRRAAPRPAPQRRPAPAAREVAPEPAEITQAPPAVVAPAPVVVDARRLAAEVAVLDRARAALRRGDASATLSLLDQHEREFADGALLAEAELVRIETLIVSGDAATARVRSRAFLTKFPQSPHAKRLRSLVDRLPSAQESP